MPSDPSSKQRVALVTGSSKGVGKGIALGLAGAGWDIVVNYNGDEAGAKVTADAVKELGQKAWIVKASVGVSSEVDAMFGAINEQAGRLDLLVNNAGVQTWSPLLELSEKDWDRTIATNLKGCFLCTQGAARLMRDQGTGGSIIQIGSGANKSVFPNLIDYCASKGGIENFTRVAAVELGPLKIRVNCVAPGAIEIERTKLEAPDYAQTWGPITPLRRVGNPGDIAGAVVFLAGDASSFITGQTIYVDGGMFSQVPWPYK